MKHEKLIPNGYYGDWIEAHDEDIQCPEYVEMAVSGIKSKILSSFGDLKFKVLDEQIVIRLTKDLVHFLPKKDCKGTIGWKALITFDENEVSK